MGEVRPTVSPPSACGRWRASCDRGGTAVEARQLEIGPVLIRRCLVCRADIAHLRAGARTCADACGNVLSRLLRSRCCPVP